MSSEHRRVPAGTVDWHPNDAPEAGASLPDRPLSSLREESHVNAADIDATLRAAGDGDLDRLTRLVSTRPELATAVGPNPYWGGRVQPLHLAVTWGREEAVTVLLQHGADPSGENDGYAGWSPLLLAAVKGYGTIARRLEIEGAFVGLFEAAALGRIDMVREILEANPERAHRTLRDGTTPLHVSATVEVADAFIEARVMPGAIDQYGGMPLDAALARAASGSEDGAAIARRLIETGLTTDAAVWAALGDLDALSATIDHDATAIRAPGRRGRLPLHAGVAHGRLDAVTWLLERGAPHNQPDADGITPLHWATRAPRNDIEIARRLLAVGADPRARDRRHDATPASWAEFQRRPELEALLRRAETRTSS